MSGARTGAVEALVGAPGSLPLLHPPHFPPSPPSSLPLLHPPTPHRLPTFSCGLGRGISPLITDTHPHASPLLALGPGIGLPLVFCVIGEE